MHRSFETHTPNTEPQNWTFEESTPISNQKIKESKTKNRISLVRFSFWYIYTYPQRNLIHKWFVEACSPNVKLGQSGPFKSWTVMDIWSWMHVHFQPMNQLVQSKHKSSCYYNKRRNSLVNKFWAQKNVSLFLTLFL